MTNALFVLLRAQLQVARNSFWRGGFGRKLGAVAVIMLLGLAAVGIYNITRFFVAALSSPTFADLLAEAAAQSPGLPTDFAPYLAAVPSAVLFGALLMLILSSFSSLLNALYLSGDIDMLLVAPVPMRAVFTLKFFSGLSTQYLLLGALLGPMLIGYGHGLGYGALYALGVVIVLLLLPLLPAGLGALMVMAVVRVLPARRAREIIGVIGGLVGLSFYLTSQFSRQVAPILASPGSLNALLASDFPLLPSAWAARALVALGTGEAVPALFYGGIFAVVSLGVFAGCLLVAERLYYAGWSNLAVQGGRVRQRSAATDPAAAPQGLFGRLGEASFGLPVQARAILLKDLRLFTRDLRNLQQVIFPLAMAAVWTFQLLRGPQDELPGDAAIGAQVQAFGSVGIVFFICLSLSGALAGGGISREGRAYWLLQAAPISPGQIFLGKLAVAYLPYPVAGTPFLILLALIAGTPPALVLQQWLLVLMAGLGCAAIAMGLGAVFPRLNWENPDQQTTWQAGCLSGLLYPLYLLVAVGAVFAAGIAADMVGGGIGGFGIQFAGWVIAALITAGATWAAAGAGIAGLRRIEV
jgi:ABC-2 type transport system permease protein